MTSDPIADMLTRIRNANLALHDDVVMPTSNVRREIARILLEEGYIADVARRDGRSPWASSSSRSSTGRAASA